MASSPSTGSAAAMLECLKRPRGKWPTQRPTMFQLDAGTPKKRLRNRFQRSSTAVAPAPISNARSTLSIASVMSLGYGFSCRARLQLLRSVPALFQFGFGDAEVARRRFEIGHGSIDFVNVVGGAGDLGGCV